jgi:hypothetical protein
MAIFDLYSKRRKRELGDIPDTVTYDVLPLAFRNQLSYIVQDAMGNWSRYQRNAPSRDTYRKVVSVLRREYGAPYLAGAGTEHDPYGDLHAFIIQETNIDRVLDVAQLAMLATGETSLHNYPDQVERKLSEELNTRFNEHGLGYQYESGEIMRTDSKVLHEEVVRPALAVLTDPKFFGANNEMLEAFEHHRHGRDKDTLTWALKALESTLKIICNERRWTIQGKGQAKDLFETVFQNNLIEPLWQSEFSGLRSVLESGVPTARNKLGGHGQGQQPTVVPPYLAAFVLHQTAAAILFLYEAHSAKP